MHKKLYRSARERMLGGVAAGIAEYFDLDPTIVRLIFVLSIFAGGAGIIAYIIMWIVIPQGPFVPYNAGSNIPPQNEGTGSGTESGDATKGASSSSTGMPGSGAGNDPNNE